MKTTLNAILKLMNSNQIGYDINESDIEKLSMHSSRSTQKTPLLSLQSTTLRFQRPTFVNTVMKHILRIYMHNSKLIFTRIFMFLVLASSEVALCTDFRRYSLLLLDLTTRD